MADAAVLNTAAREGVRVRIPAPVPPLYESPSPAAVASASKSVIFGDFSAYHSVRVASIRVELSLVGSSGADQVAVRSVDRFSGDMPDVTADAQAVSANSCSATGPWALCGGKGSPPRRTGRRAGLSCPASSPTRDRSPR